MHRFPFYIYPLLAAALYVSVSGCATSEKPAPVISPSPPAVRPAVSPLPAASAVEAAGQVELMPPVEAPPAVEVQPLGQPSLSLPAASEKPEPHIALLLPLKSAAFGTSADAVHLGFLAAAGSQSHVLPIKVYGSFEEGKDIAMLYQLAIANGAKAVAGPLTRDGVAALAAQAEITVPTLALNLAEGKSADKLYFFGLSAEAEARQVAQMASAAKLHYATIVSTETPLSKRLVLAFSAEWQALGGSITAEVLFNNNPAVLALLPTAPGDPPPTPIPPPLTASGVEDPNFIAPPVIAPGNMVFLAADAEKARLIRPYLNAALPVYAASQIFNSNADALTNYDLNDIRFVDMPWLLQPDHPAVMIYPRPLTPLEPDKERLYALGIDAFRLLQLLLDNSYRTALPLDGVTGHIFLKDHQFHREGLPAQIRQGRAQLNVTDFVPPKPVKPLLPNGQGDRTNPNDEGRRVRSLSPTGPLASSPPEGESDKVSLRDVHVKTPSPSP